MAKHSFEGIIRLESSILRQDDDELFQVCLEFELNSVRQEALTARRKAMEELHANKPTFPFGGNGP